MGCLVSKQEHWLSTRHHQLYKILYSDLHLVQGMGWGVEVEIKAEHAHLTVLHWFGEGRVGGLV